MAPRTEKDPGPLLRAVLFVVAAALGLLDTAPATAQPALREILDQGRALVRSGNRTEAKELYRQTMETVDPAIEPTPELGALINELAQLHHGDGAYAEAEELYLRVLDIVEGLFSADHTNVAASCYNLAILYHETGRLEDAEAYYRRAVWIWIRESHPLARSALRGLTTIYTGQGRYRALLELLRGVPVSSSPAGRDVLLSRVEQAYRLAAGDPPDARDLVYEAFEVAQWAQAIEESDTPVTGLDTVALSQVRSRLGEGEILLAYLVAPERSYVWAVRPDREAMGLLDVTATALAQEVARRTADPSSPPLDATLLEPVASYLDDATAVFVVPDGPLVEAPFASLLRDRPGVRIETVSALESWRADATDAPPTVLEPLPPPEASSVPTESASASTATTPPVSPTSAGNFWVQLASRPSRAEAESDLAKLAGRFSDVLAEVPNRIVAVDLGGDGPVQGTWHRIQFGPLSDRATARRLCAALAERGHGDCLVVKP